MLLKEQIVSGRFVKDERLPTQDALCEQYAVSRITVRRALVDLQAEDLIRNEQGVGTFVTFVPSDAAQRPNLGVVAELNRAFEETRVRVLALEVQRCPRAVAGALRLPADVDALHILRTRFKGETPVMVLDAWIPQQFASQVTVGALATTPLYQLVSGGADQLGRIVQEVNAALASPLVAHALDVDVNSAVLRIDRLVHNLEGAPIQHMTIWSTPQRSRLVMEAPGGDPDQTHVGRLFHDPVKS